MKRELITIGFDKNGEADFRIRGDFSGLSYEELNEIRKIIPVAIYVVEDMWRRNNQPESANQANQ